MSAGADGQSLIADSTQANGIKWGQVDHTTLSNIGTNTHAQIDTFISSKGAAGGLASLDGTSNVPTSQLDNVGSTTVVSNMSTNVGTMLNFFRPWSESGWSADLNAVKSAGGATQVPVYEAAINGGSNNTYFVNVDAGISTHCVGDHLVKKTCRRLRECDPVRQAPCTTSRGVVDR
jgi:hypothetical protein